MATTKASPRFVLCIRAEGMDDLDARKVYEVIPDAAAKGDGYLRVIDESGKGYLYSVECFVAVALPVAAVRELIAPRRVG